MCVCKTVYMNRYRLDDLSANVFATFEHLC